MAKYISNGSVAVWWAGLVGTLLLSPCEVILALYWVNLLGGQEGRVLLEWKLAVEYSVYIVIIIILEI